MNLLAQIFLRGKKKVTFEAFHVCNSSRRLPYNAPVSLLQSSGSGVYLIGAETGHERHAKPSGRGEEAEQDIQDSAAEAVELWTETMTTTSKLGRRVETMEEGAIKRGGRPTAPGRGSC